MKKLKLKKLDANLFKKSEIKMEQSAKIKGGGYTVTLRGRDTDYFDNL